MWKRVGYGIIGLACARYVATHWIVFGCVVSADQPCDVSPLVRRSPFLAAAVLFGIVFLLSASLPSSEERDVIDEVADWLVLLVGAGGTLLVSLFLARHSGPAGFLFPALLLLLLPFAVPKGLRVLRRF
jgi:hypothetical protein